MPGLALEAGRSSRLLRCLALEAGKQAAEVLCYLASPTTGAIPAQRIDWKHAAEQIASQSQQDEARAPGGGFNDFSFHTASSNAMPTQTASFPSFKVRNFNLQADTRSIVTQFISIISSHKLVSSSCMCRSSKWKP
jgi:hypothetical protein